MSAGIIPARAGSSQLRHARRPTRWDHPRACGEQEDQSRRVGGELGSSPRVRGAAHSTKRPQCPNRDHPRACGEQARFELAYRSYLGSSPRVRGADYANRLECHKIGIIPARAGSSRCSMRRSGESRDHPRACGEQPPDYVTLLSNLGSSPRVRGADVGRRAGHVEDGIIPARAGSSAPISENYCNNRDHPRACGEQFAAIGVKGVPRGSSPRVRGAVEQRCDGLRGRGIIPARAGSRLLDKGRISSRRDHPRACGEQLIPSSLMFRAAGSSPRVRGAELRDNRADCALGIIPARAGSRVSTSYPRVPHGDHPRACGEQSSMVSRQSGRMGSSPRVRGAGHRFPRLGTAAGIIPARAGSSCGAWSRKCSRWDHPRACGEQSESRRPGPPVSGSSPRVRGAEHSTSSNRFHGGIIPARAGSRRPHFKREASRRDHPRACGEQLEESSKRYVITGSSPRVRGAVEGPPIRPLRPGIIPARAGSSYRKWNK